MRESPANCPALVTFVMLMATAAHTGRAARHGHHAERDGDGKITQANGHAVVKARPERILDGRGGLLCLLQGEHLEKRMGRGRGYLKNSPPSLPSGV